ncbi:lysozyme C-1-like [Spea bombifrons]|uniref:lysozyme C-1-like n=1 Tax=Spea bombifrons TaxID=233779 RepID=UPI00234BB3F6|nr:lysozyme C-1-like [Spea bombifrons]
MKGFFLLLLLLAPAANCWVIDKCALAQKLKEGGVIGIKNYKLEDYLCLAHYASGYDTSMHTSRTEYGIFQINSFWWCTDGKTIGRKNICGMRCSDLLDEDVTDDIRCLNRIVREPKGLESWIPWEVSCKGKDVSSFSDGC